MKHITHVYWITGLSGSGKTTLGTALVNRLKEDKQPTIFLDGDVMRDILNTTTGLDKHERYLLSMKYAKLCKTLNSQGFNVVCATISLFHQTQAWNRNNIKNYIEIFLRVPVSELTKRDPKKIYARAHAGEICNVVGLDIPAEYPKTPDITFDHADNLTVDNAVTQIILYQKNQFTSGDKK